MHVVNSERIPIVRQKLMFHQVSRYIHSRSRDISRRCDHCFNRGIVKKWKIPRRYKSFSREARRSHRLSRDRLLNNIIVDCNRIAGCLAELHFKRVCKILIVRYASVYFLRNFIDKIAFSNKMARKETLESDSFLTTCSNQIAIVIRDVNVVALFPIISRSRNIAMNMIMPLISALFHYFSSITDQIFIVQRVFEVQSNFAIVMHIIKTH